MTSTENTVGTGGEAEREPKTRPEGAMVMVPREPTEAMLEQATESLIAQYDANGDWDDAKDVIEKLDAGALYRAMIAATQQSPISGEGWQDISTAPRDGTPFYARAQSPYRWHPYKPSSEQYRSGKRGRWQTMTEYGGWENCPEPVGDWKHHPNFAPPVPSVSGGEDQGSSLRDTQPGTVETVALRYTPGPGAAGAVVLRDRLSRLIRLSIGEFIIGQTQADNAADFILSEGCPGNHGEAYQVISEIACAGGLFGHPDVMRALDYFADPKGEILPFAVTPEPAVEGERSPGRWQVSECKTVGGESMIVTGIGDRFGVLGTALRAEDAAFIARAPLMEEALLAAEERYLRGLMNMTDAQVQRVHTLRREALGVSNDRS